MSSPLGFPPGTIRQRVRRQSLEVTVEGWRRAIAQIGRSLGPDDDWSAVLLLESRAEERVIVPLDVLFLEQLAPVGKDMAAVAIPLLVEEADAWLAGLVTTAWMSEVPAEGIELEPDGVTLRRGVPPSEDPNRIEIVMLALVGEDGTEQHHAARIVRRPDRPPALRPWEVHSERGAVSLGGRFGNALRAAFGMEPYTPEGGTA